MGVRGTYYGGIVLDGLIFHVDASKQESYAKRGIRYMQAGNSNLFMDFADTFKNPSTNNSQGNVINGVTFSNFAPYHLSDYTTPYWHNPATAPWKDSAGIGTFYGNMEFDGSNDHINFGNTPEMNINDITVSAWFYINKFKPDVTSMIAARYAELSPSNGWSLAYDNQGVVYFSGRESGAEYLSVTASITVKSSNSGLTANGGWYNAVGTKSGNVWKIYVSEPNRYIKYNTISADATIYTYPYKQSLLGTRTMGNGTTPFTTNNLYVGRVGFTPGYYMDGRLMSLSVYNRALSLEEINQNYDSFSKRLVKTAFDRGLNNPNVLITYATSSLDNDITNTITGITARETSLGKNVTVLTYEQLPNDLSLYSHIWDVDYITNQIVIANSTKYTNYLQGGGALFLLGEHAGYASRNNTLVTLLNSLGAGSIALDTPYQTNNPSILFKVENQFLLENSNSSVRYPAAGRYQSIGTGIDIVKSAEVYGSYPVGSGGVAVLWKTGSLTNAPKGAIVSVMDVNIWQPNFANTPYNGSDFIKNVSLILDRF